MNDVQPSAFSMFIVVFAVMMFFAAIVGGVAALAGAPMGFLAGYFVGSGFMALFTAINGVAQVRKNARVSE